MPLQATKLSFHFKFFLCLVVAALILPELFRDGIFMDGNLYASVAVNFARGEGSFWNPHFSKTSMSFFHEQPPLMFGLLGTVYRFCGEHMLVERFYSLVVFLLSAVIFMQIWKLLFPPDHHVRAWGWMALLIWIVIPNSFWVVIHNLEENTMGLFVLLTVYLQLKSMNAAPRYGILFVFLSALSLTGAFLTKGFPGLFPIVFFPLIFFLLPESINREKSRFVFYYFFFFSVLILLFALIFFHPVSSPLMRAWLLERVLNSIQHVTTTDNRFGILVFLLMQLIPVMCLLVVLGLLSRWKKISWVKTDKTDTKKALLFLLLGIAGSFPLVITREQRGFYLATSYPYYAIAFSIYMSPLFNVLKKAYWEDKTIKRFQSLNYIFLVLIISVTVSLLPEPKRDKEKFHDFKIIASKMSYGDYLQISGAMWNDWELQTAMVREKYISITPDSSLSKVLLLDQQTISTYDTSCYQRLSWPLRWYTAFRKKQ